MYLNFLFRIILHLKYFLKCSLITKVIVFVSPTYLPNPDQLEHAQVTQTELMRESFHHNQEIGDLLRRQEDLQERLGEEGRAREQLALELHRAEGEWSGGGGGAVFVMGLF